MRGTAGLNDRACSTATAATQPTPGLSYKTWATRDPPAGWRVSRFRFRRRRDEPGETTATAGAPTALGVRVPDRAAPARHAVRQGEDAAAPGAPRGAARGPDVGGPRRAADERQPHPDRHRQPQPESRRQPGARGPAQASGRAVLGGRARLPPDRSALARPATGAPAPSPPGCRATFPDGTAPHSTRCG